MVSKKKKMVSKKKEPDYDKIIAYKCRNCGCEYDVLDEAKKCCQPCRHTDLILDLDGEYSEIYCVDCDLDIALFEFDQEAFIKYLMKNHKKCGFIKNYLEV